jgi:hypothetical protein
MMSVKPLRYGVFFVSVGLVVWALVVEPAKRIVRREGAILAWQAA